MFFVCLTHKQRTVNTVAAERNTPVGGFTACMQPCVYLLWLWSTSVGHICLRRQFSGLDFTHMHTNTLVTSVTIHCDASLCWAAASKSLLKKILRLECVFPITGNEKKSLLYKVIIVLMDLVQILEVILNKRIAAIRGKKKNRARYHVKMWNFTK